MDHFVDLALASGGTPFLVAAAKPEGSMPYTFAIQLGSGGAGPSLLAPKLVGDGFPGCNLQGASYAGVEVADGIEGRMTGLCSLGPSSTQGICFDGGVVEKSTRGQPSGGAAFLSSGSCVMTAGGVRSLFVPGAGWSNATNAADIQPSSLGRFGSRDAYVYLDSKMQATLVDGASSSKLGAATAGPKLAELGGALWAVLPQRTGPQIVSGDAATRCDYPIDRSANDWVTLSTLSVGGGLLTAYGFNNGDGNDELVFLYTRPGVGTERVRLMASQVLPANIWLFESGGTVYIATRHRDSSAVVYLNPLCQ